MAHVSTSIAKFISSSDGTLGAMRIFESLSSILYGNVEPAAVNLTPASDARLTIRFAHPGTSREIK